MSEEFSARTEAVKVIANQRLDMIVLIQPDIQAEGGESHIHISPDQVALTIEHLQTARAQLRPAGAAQRERL